MSGSEAGMMDMRKLEKTGMGKTPDDIQDKCLKLCQNYLGGVWTKQTIETITVTRLTGGMLNQLYYCAINAVTDGTNGVTKGVADLDLEDRDVPTEVAIKITQKKPFLEESDEEEKNRLLSELIVTLMVSENGLGPKVYGVFDGGVILKYYRQIPFKVEQQGDETLVKEVWEKLARFHAMDVPVQRNKKSLMIRWTDENYKLCNDKNFVEDCVAANIQVFVDNDLHSEYKFILDLIEKCKSPKVFTHNDYRSDNLMVLTDVDKKSDRIVVCDYEFAVYGYRAMDLVHISKEWGNDNAFFDRQNLYYPPDESVLKRLFQYYIDQSVRIFGPEFSENPLNSISHLIKELKVFWLVLQFGSALPFGKLLDENHVVPEEMLRFFGGKRPDKQQLMKMAEHGYKNYLTLKNKFKEEKLF